MSQQINLLPRKDRSISTAIWPFAGVAVVLLGLGAYLQSMVAENSRLRQKVGAGEQELVKAKNALQLLQKQKSARGDAAALTTEIAALRPRVEAANQIVKEIGSGSLGSPEGFSRYFKALGGVSEDGLWVTGVAVTKGGTVVSISGRALRNESVMQYARRLNETFSPYGVRFNSLELTPLSLSKSKSPAAPPLMTVAFKLS